MIIRMPPENCFGLRRLRERGRDERCKRRRERTIGAVLFLECAKMGVAKVGGRAGERASGENV